MQEPQQTRYYHEPVEPHTSNRGVNILIAIFITAFFALVIVGAVAAHQTLIQAGVLFFYGSLVLVPLVISAIVGYFFWHKWYMDRIKRRHASLDALAKETQVQMELEAHQVQMYLAQSRLLPDAQGNRPFIFNPRTYEIVEVASGNYLQPVPAHLHYETNYSDTSTRPAPESQNLLASGAQPPTIESIIAQLPFNELLTAYGVTLAGGKLITASIPESVHFKLVGGSGFGKSCEAAALLRIATFCNDAEHLQIALLDLEHKTSRLFEDLPHVAEIKVGKKSVSMAMSEPSADEVAHKLTSLVYELQRRAAKNIETPVILIYVEEMLSLQYEVDEALLNGMLANLAILAVRGRKYGMFLEACTQADYSTNELRAAQKQFRSRIAFAIDPSAARASGFHNTELIKQNFQTGQPGQFVLEKPGFSEIMIAPALDVKQELKRLEYAGVATVSEVTPRPSLDLPHRDSTQAHQAHTNVTPINTPAWEAILQQVWDLQNSGFNQTEIIEKVWQCKKGTNARYQSAREDYQLIDAEIKRRKAEIEERDA